MYKRIFNWEIWSAPAVLVYQKHNMHFKKLLAYILHFYLRSRTLGHIQTFSFLYLLRACLFQNNKNKRENWWSAGCLVWPCSHQLSCPPRAQTSTPSLCTSLLQILFHVLSTVSGCICFQYSCKDCPTCIPAEHKEHRRASADLHYCSSQPCHQMHAPTNMLRNPGRRGTRCHLHSQATWALLGGKERGEFSCKIPEALFLFWMGSYPVVFTAWGMLEREQLIWGPDFGMPQIASPQTEVWTWAWGSWRFSHSFSYFAGGRY